MVLPGCSSARIHASGMSREPCVSVYQVVFSLTFQPCSIGKVSSARADPALDATANAKAIVCNMTTGRMRASRFEAS